MKARTNLKQKQNHLKTVGLIMVITLVGKVLGLVRDMLLGHNFGTGMESTAFLTASRIPRTFFDAIFAAAISSSFIPVFAQRMEREGKEDAFRLSHSFFTWVGLLTAAMSLLGMIFAEPLVGVLAKGFDAETAALCARLLRMLFPTVFFTGLAFSMVGVLQSMGEFYIPAALSAVSNGIIIVYYLFFCDRFGITGLAWAFLLGWASQALIQLPWLHRHDFHYRPRLSHPALKSVFTLMLPVMVSTWIQPVNQLISTRFASYLFSGAGASAMEYANTLYTMLAGILVLSITNVIFPEMSRLSSAQEEAALGDLIGDTLRGMLFLLLPMTLGLALLAEPLVRLLYEWGSWDSFSTQITARALCFMSLGMVGYGVQNVLSRAFYAQQNGRVPMITGAVSIVVNLVLCWLLSGALDVAGLSIATAASATVSGLLLLIPIMKKYAFGRDFWLGLLKMLLCTLGMGLVVFLVSRNLSCSDGLFGRVLQLGVPTLSGIVTYFLLALLLRVRELDTVLQKLRRK
jgi:putative peptidoglycan lipid II flippase